MAIGRPGSRLDFAAHLEAEDKGEQELPAQCSAAQRLRCNGRRRPALVRRQLGMQRGPKQVPCPLLVQCDRRRSLAALACQEPGELARGVELHAAAIAELGGQAEEPLFLTNELK